MRYRYILFGFDTYYPLGGMNDCKGEFTTKDGAIACIQRIGHNRHDYWQIYDKQTQEILNWISIEGISID